MQFVLRDRDWLFGNQRLVGAAVGIGDGVRHQPRRAGSGDLKQFDGDALGGTSALGVEHMGRQPATDFQTVGAGDALIEAERDDTENLIQRRFALRRGIIAEAFFELAQDRVFAVPAHANDEGNVEFRVIGIVKPVEIGEFIVREPIQSGARLLAFGIVGDGAGERCFAGEIGWPLISAI